jgi:ATP-dependent RNA helicase DDX3X
MMFSATFPKDARTLARKYMAQDHYRIRVGRPGQSHKNIRQDVIEVSNNPRDLKNQAVYDLLNSMDPMRTLIFCNYNDDVEKLDDFLYNRGMPVTSITSKRNQREREDAL